MFKKYDGNPVIPRKDGTFGSIHMANPDLLEFQGKLYLYYRGQGNEKHDQIGVAFSDKDKFDGVNWEHYPNNPIIKVSENRSDFDSNHILDPGTAVIDGKVFLYYSGHSFDRPACIGLTISNDGINFKKHGPGPVIESAIAPEVVIKDGLVYLFYQRKVKDHFEFFLCTGSDGISFDKKDEKKIFGPSCVPDTFDHFSVSTCRIFQEENLYYMIYGGGDKFDDYPPAFGLARSRDLVNWERYPNNPVMERGLPGTWDEGGIWFGTTYKYKDSCYLWYEGCGAGLGVSDSAALEASDRCRNFDYGGYAKVSFSQIGLAVYKGEMPVW